MFKLSLNDHINKIWSVELRHETVYTVAKELTGHLADTIDVYY